MNPRTLAKDLRVDGRTARRCLDAARSLDWSPRDLGALADDPRVSPAERRALRYLAHIGRVGFGRTCVR